MGSRELIECLNREADERAQKIRSEAGAEAQKILQGARAKTEALARQLRAEQGDMSRNKAAEITAEAEVQSRILRTRASGELAGRLRAIADAALGELRAADYEGVFRALAAEIPEGPWKAVRVNPADAGLASSVFAGLEVQGDGGITGGMEVAAEGGSVRISNTFDKRLERAWQEILPALLREAYDACGSGD